ncbi:chemotaxis protein CheA [Hylemonella gracilis]|uniref:Chemotaxis protein CheA n=1 Tax=Hylemonella gracilis TaxID=80880 RepID=A0A4P6UKG8_9BURK|nr:chemotaxis protein CheA [Hylemonella gracilis]QBK05858.1 chemotaxis protein CheA [Hylemonella gracilis]
MNLDAALKTFIVESREMLVDMENALLTIEQTPDRDESVNAIFRAAHTIKGSAGLFGLDHIVAFTHVVESVLDHVRDGHLEIDDELVVLLLSSGDHLGTLITAIEEGQMSASEALDGVTVPLLAQLRTYVQRAGGPALADASITVSTAVATTREDDARLERIARDGTDPRSHWHISLRFGPNVLRNGMDPLSFIRYLGRLGKIVGIATLPDALPPAAQMDSESCYLGFEIAFSSSASKSTIEGVFEFVRDDARIRIIPPEGRLQEYADLIRELPEQDIRLGEILVHCGSITQHELEEALSIQQNALADAQTAGQADPEVPMLGKILIDQQVVEPQLVDAALEKQKRIIEKKSGDGKAQENKTVRVDADKLDQLINLVGELIIEGATSSLLARQSGNPQLEESTSRLSGLVQQVRDSALQLRMVKIGGTFSRFNRVVHDVARELGKDIVLRLSGEDTELDKTVVERIGDPLTHLVRNSMDHGIEPVERRLALGKPARGTVSLNAYHDSGSIVIEVGDDGGGLRRDKIFAKAVERGLIDPGRVLTDSEVYALIFEPGFSTADTVTNLSGRGVGMDVVKRNITALRGSVDIQSVENVGTTVTVRLPLTLAIINGFQVSVGGSVFVIPLDMVEECVAYSDEGESHYTNLRGEVLPFVRLREIFDLQEPLPSRQNIVVVRHGRQKAGIVVDALNGELQTVIKPLGKVFQRVRAISGSTILGSGDVALILDVPALLQEATEEVPSIPDP